MHAWETFIYIVLFVAFLLFNCCFWIGQWSISGNESQGLYEWCFLAEDKSCCKSVLELEIDTQGNKYITNVEIDIDFFHDN